MDFITEIKKLIPSSPDDAIDWDNAEKLLTGSGFSDMKNVPQNPTYHAEGDVFTHTKMVCEKLIADPSFYELNDTKRTETFLAALLHDVGKTKTSVFDGEKWTSPHHASTGSKMVREFLWKNCGISGTPEKMNFRETVCALIRSHGLALNIDEYDNAELAARLIASTGELAADFSWDMLATLTKADASGRIADDLDELILKADLSRIIANDAACLYSPYPFPDDFTRYAYLSGRRISPDVPLFNDTWGEVIIMSALPGTGKDAYISQHFADLPMISLDDIRRSMKISPEDEQGAVIQAAKELAKVHLRAKRPFVWNATDLTKDTRRKIVDLVTDYNARARIIYLETDNLTRENRNTTRAAHVPENAVDKMRAKTVPPALDEAHSVEWICV